MRISQFSLKITDLLFLNLLIAVGHFGFGLLGLILTSPVEPATFIMPSSGFALAVLLSYGFKGFIGLFISDFLLQIWGHEGDFLQFWHYLICSIGLASSSLLGFFLYKKYIGLNSPLLKPKHIALFIALSACFCCLAAFSRTHFLLATHAIHKSDLLWIWLSVWFSEFLGIIIFTPLVLVFIGYPKEIWRKRLHSVALPLFAAVILMGGMFFYLRDHKRQQYSDFLAEHSMSLANSLHARIQLETSAFSALKKFMTNFQPIDLNNVTHVADQVQSSFKEIKGISWIMLKDGVYNNNSSLFQLDRSSTVNIISIPDRIKKRLLSAPELTNTDILLPNQHELNFILPVVDKQNPRNKQLGLIYAVVDINALVEQAFANFNKTYCTMTIRVKQDSAIEDEAIFSNAKPINPMSCFTGLIKIFGQTFFLDFSYDSALKPDINQYTYIWPIRFGLSLIAALSIILLLLTGRIIRTDTVITERNRLLTQNKKAAETANNSQNIFLAKISHELRTPLHGICGFTQLLEKRPALSLEDKKQVGIIKQCADDLLKLINSILDISVLENKQMKLEFAEFNFNNMFSESIQVAELKAVEKGLSLLANNTCPKVNLIGDEKRLKQIISNLIDNAIKYTQHGKVVVNAIYHNGNLQVTVSDTGCGIDKEDFNRIFSPFVQIGDNHFVQEGIGLGLAIAHEIVVLMNGQININSTLGQGSEFRVIIPMPYMVSEQIKPAAKANNSHHFQQINVLVVDDNEFNLLFLVSLLEQLGLTVEAAQSGEKALSMLCIKKFDLALIDINMPFMDGLELVKRIRILNLTVKIVAVSAYADESKINEAYVAGVDDYLTKPVEEQQLLELIQAILTNTIG